MPLSPIGPSPRPVRFARALASEAEAQAMETLIEKHFGSWKASRFNPDIAVVIEEKWPFFDRIRQYFELRQDVERLKKHPFAIGLNVYIT